MKSEEVLKSLVIRMANSTDWGERFYKEFVPGTIKTWFSLLTEQSQYKLKQLEVEENSNTRWVANFHNNLGTDEKYFSYNKKAIMDGGLGQIVGESISNDQKLVFVMNLLSMPAHEFRHYEQEGIMIEGDLKKINPMSIIFAKENIVSREMYNFYIKNHDLFLQEIDANIKRCEYSMDFLAKSNLTNIHSIKRIFDTYAYTLQKYKKEMDEYLKKGGFCEIISSSCDGIMMKLDSQKREMYLRKFPVLNVLYKHTGEKRTYNEIIEFKKRQRNLHQNNLQDKIIIEGEEVYVSKNIDRLYDVIISTDKNLRKQQEDFERPREMTPGNNCSKEDKEKVINVSYGRGR